MIALIDGRGVGEPDRRRLRRCDPMLGQPLVIDPMPGATCRELVVSIYRELGVPSGLAAKLHREAKPLLPLRAWRLPALIILDADFLGRDALADVDALPGPRISTIIATFDRAGADAELLRPEALRRIVTRCCSDGPHDSPEPGDHAVQRVGAVSRQVHEVFAGGVRSVPELALVSAAATIFNIPRSLDATRLRLAGFDDALRSYGFQLVCSDSLLDSARRAQWPRPWLADALEPTVQRPPDLTLPNVLATALYADETSLEAFVCGQAANTGRYYRSALTALLTWRRDHGIAPHDHRGDHLVDWGHDRLRDHAALGSVYAGIGCARSYYAFLRTGEVRSRATMTEHVEFARRPEIRRQAVLVDPYEQAWNDTPAHETTPQPEPVYSPSARRLMARKGWTATQFRHAIDASFAYVDPGILLPYCGADRHSHRALQRHVARFQGVLFVLKHDIAVSALPPEVRAGSPRAVAAWLKHAREAGPWAHLIDSLRDQPRFTGIDWDRAL